MRASTTYSVSTGLDLMVPVDSTSSEVLDAVPESSLVGVSGWLYPGSKREKTQLL